MHVPLVPLRHLCCADAAPLTLAPRLTFSHQVSVTDDGATTTIDITDTDVSILGTTKQRWAVQCKPINSYDTTVGWSAAVYAASGESEVPPWIAPSGPHHAMPARCSRQVNPPP